MSTTASISRRPRALPLALRRALPLALLLAAALATGALATAALAAEETSRGQVLSVEGTVSGSRDGGGSWQPVAPRDAVFEGHVLRAGRQSRAAIVLVDGTQLRLGPYSTLEVKSVTPQVAPASRGADTGGSGTRLELDEGELWVRSKNRGRDLAVDTPAATAAIRGTEVAIRSRDEVSEVVVVEGRVDLYNEAGSLTLAAGEGGRARRGEAPVAFTVVEPENAVQWILYYPDLWPPLPPAAGPVTAAAHAGEWQTVLAATADLDDASSAASTSATATERVALRLRALAATGSDVEAFAAALGDRLGSSPELLDHLAAARLATGDATAAAATLERALAVDPRHPRSLALAALLALARNDSPAADAFVDRALAVDGDHPLARLAAARVAQAQLDLPRALAHAERAHQLDPTSVEAAALRAELLYGSDRRPEAAAVSAELVARYPLAPRALSVAGFIALGDDDLVRAAELFDRALGVAPELAEAHLGLGLVRFARGDLEGGLLEMLAATTLAPRVSLYHSYLGKAYHQLRLFDEALDILAIAERLDPRDPTPDLYAGLVLRDLRRLEEATLEIASAIRKNDFRAVYRSRFLLDRDEATRNVSLADLYREVRFTSLGAHHAVRSLELDYGSSSAHLFAAGTLIAEPDRTAAAGSALLTARLLQPVNENSFLSFNDYTSLLEVPGASTRVTAVVGEDELERGSLASYGGVSRFAYGGFVEASEHGDRLGPNSDADQLTGNLLAKVRLGSRSSLLVDVFGSSGEQGSPGGVLILADDSGGLFPIRLQRPLDPDRDARAELGIGVARLGVDVALGGGSHLLFVGSGSHERIDSRDPDFFDQPFFDPSIHGCGLDSEDRADLASLQGLHYQRQGRHQLWYGAEVHEAERDRRQRIRCLSGPFAGSVETFEELEGTDRAWSGHLRWAYTTAGESLTVTAGGRYSDLRLVDLYFDSSRDEDTLWAPELGLRWSPSERTVLRLGGFRHLEVGASDSVAPALLAGFATRRSEAVGTRRDEVSVALEHVASPRLFTAVTLYGRAEERPSWRPVDELASSWRRTFDDVDTLGLVADLEWRWSSRWTSFQRLHARRIELPPADQEEARYRFGARWVHPRGFFLDLGETFLYQRFTETTVALPETAAWLTDLAFVWELPEKRGRLGVAVDNVFEQGFDVVIEGLSVDQELPVRRGRVFLEVDL